MYAAQDSAISVLGICTRDILLFSTKRQAQGYSLQDHLQLQQNQETICMSTANSEVNKEIIVFSYNVLLFLR